MPHTELGAGANRDLHPCPHWASNRKWKDPENDTLVSSDPVGTGENRTRKDGGATVTSTQKTGVLGGLSKRLCTGRPRALTPHFLGQDLTGKGPVRYNRQHGFSLSLLNAGACAAGAELGVIQPHFWGLGGRGVAELGSLHVEAEGPLRAFSSILSGAACAPLLCSGGKEDSMLKPQPSRGSQPTGQADCLWQEKDKQGAIEVLVDSARGPRGRPHGGEDTEKGLDCKLV